MIKRRSFFALLLAFFRKSQNINADDKLRLMRDATKIYQITRDGHSFDVVFLPPITYTLGYIKEPDRGDREQNTKTMEAVAGTSGNKS